tara:strand:+ start:90922 stop:92109 length:1188 start_codon:yes stop_codon:yes gene_type:complete
MHGDGAGLWLQVSKYYTKSWIFRYTFDGKTRDMGLGSLNTISLARAREKARDARELIVDGIDPIEERKAKRVAQKLARAGAMTFKQSAQLYIEAHEPSWKNSKHISQWKNTLITYVYPVFGDTPVGQIETAHIVKAIQPIWNSKNETASRIRGRIEVVLDWAKTSGLRNGENPARWRGHLNNLLPKPSRVKTVRHMPALPYKDIPKFMTDLSGVDGVSARALEFTILNVPRTGEVRKALWGEIDWDEAIWIIPGERMKAGKEHKVPLSERSLDILRAMKRVSQGHYIFPGSRAGNPLSEMSMLMTLRRMGVEDVTVHGFRSTFKDWAADCTTYQNEVSEMALAHTIDNKSEAAYRRGELLEKRKNLMKDWAKYCFSNDAIEKIVSLAGTRDEGAS